MKLFWIFPKEEQFYINNDKSELVPPVCFPREPISLWPGYGIISMVWPIIFTHYLQLSKIQSVTGITLLWYYYLGLIWLCSDRLSLAIIVDYCISSILKQNIFFADFSRVWFYVWFWCWLSKNMKCHSKILCFGEDISGLLDNLIGPLRLAPASPVEIW